MTNVILFRNNSKVSLRRNNLIILALQNVKNAYKVIASVCLHVHWWFIETHNLWPTSSVSHETEAVSKQLKIVKYLHQVSWETWMRVYDTNIVHTPKLRVGLPSVAHLTAGKCVYWPHKWTDCY